MAFIAAEEKSASGLTTVKLPHISLRYVPRSARLLFSCIVATISRNNISIGNLECPVHASCLCLGEQMENRVDYQVEFAS